VGGALRKVVVMVAAAKVVVVVALLVPPLSRVFLLRLRLTVGVVV
jgi:hypothetical protein